MHLLSIVTRSDHVLDQTYDHACVLSSDLARYVILRRQERLHDARKDAQSELFLLGIVLVQHVEIFQELFGHPHSELLQPRETGKLSLPGPLDKML